MRSIRLALLLVLFALPAFAATTPNSVVTAQTPNLGVVQFLAGTDTAGTYKTLYTAGTNGSKLVAMYANSNDASATHLVTCQIVRSTVKYGGIAFTAGISAGFSNAILPINVFSPTIWAGLPVDGNGNPYLYMVSGDTLQCTYATTITATDAVSLQVIAADF